MTTKADKQLELLRSSIMNSSGVEEKVEVNQRHLIDKILARYSAEYVLYRELMQNADDASSSSIQIYFHTSSPDPSKPPNLQSKCNRIVFKNNGMAFRPEDWTRLKRIAEGNPDEQKIGAFGVGFYSLFSVCENPFVFSGAQCMAFYFKGDQLFAKRADIPVKDIDIWTSFLMDLREPMEMPDFDQFCRFLTTSMGFTANLKQVSVFFDNQPIFHINKSAAEPRPMVIDARRMITSSPERMFTLTSCDMRQIQLEAEKYTPPTIFSPFANFLTGKSSSNQPTQREKLPMEKGCIFLRVVTGQLQVNVTQEYEKEMERATKKKPPKTTKFQLVYTGKEELDASENTNQIFKDLIPFPEQGRIFIGFPTHQTTGCCCHMASRFIPTVERESIDFADRYISVWNRELLAVGGLLARMVYNDEMDQIGRLYPELVNHGGQGQDDAKLMFEKRAAHALQSFTFGPSTPSSVVGNVHEQRFFNSCKSYLDIMTSHGIKPVNRARTVPDRTSVTGHVITELLDTFIKNVPTLTHIMAQECKESLVKLEKLSMLVALGIKDVLAELETRSLKPEEMVACMKWWIECNKGNKCIPAATRAVINEATRAEFLDAAVMDCGEDKGLLQLSHTRWWVNPKIIPLDMPFPHDTMPFSISKHFTTADLQSYFCDMSELTVYNWVKYIVATKPELETSKEFAEQILRIVSKKFQNFSGKGQQEIVNLLKEKKCIPTIAGMTLPKQAYFTSVNLFDDLPILAFNQPRSVSEYFLTALEVRKHVDLQMIFDRLVSDGSWSHIDLAKYLASVQSTLTETEARRLRETAIFTKQGEEPTLKEIEKSTGKFTDDGQPIYEKVTKKIYKRYRAGDLYAPTKIAQDLKLPLLYWNTQWKSGNEEAKFLVKLGLLTSPPLATLLLLAAPEPNMTDERKTIQKIALSWFIDHAKDYPYYDVNKIQLKFLPCFDGKTFATPRDCFTNSDAHVLGFQVLHDDLVSVRDKLGVKENPPADRLLQAFTASTPTDLTICKKRLEYMASRLGDFSSSQLSHLKTVSFIPVKENDVLTLKTPTSCYFESEHSANYYKDLFTYVDFGSHANSFLRSCGVKDEPTTVELAAIIVKDPQLFYNKSSGGERYLSVLRQIAGQIYVIKSNQKLFQDMKTKPFLVGIKRTILSPKITDDTANEEPNEDFVQHRLAKASDIFISDDTMGQQIFNPLSAPMEPQLEEFYAMLGSKTLSSQIHQAYSYASSMGVTPRTKEITKLIFERTPIIVYQMVHDDPGRRKELRRDDKYVEKHLKVIQVHDLKMTRTFKYTKETDIQPTTSCADAPKFTIYISSAKEMDYYDIASSLCSLMFTRTRTTDAMVFERHLTASLLNLKRKGIPVDRILNSRKHVEVIPTPPPSTSPIAGTSSTPAPVPQVPTMSAKDVDKYTQQVQDVFRDCQEGYIRQLITQQTQNHAQNVINKLLHEDYPKNKTNEKQVMGSVTSEEEQAKLLEQQRQEQAQKDKERSSGFMNRFWSTIKTTPPPTPPPVELPKPIVEKPKLPKSDTTITPNFTSNIQQNLKRGIHSCKPYAGKDVYAPPRINEVKEASTYCDATPGQDLTYAGNRWQGLRVY
ncbi:uncharacterized protein EV154DRAFT_475102 [Mucor mucedo]|uniref:uncharacterized protein n=1 Tax=Mucor mucedo TaxID=29922 RepID=UPI00221E9AF1|nr:uncharacterized protein EV154DRAFT_475102 [Mucor mucedo]KAI7866109.1 hypothetical protein EV154DRAFT_475102 [Mucor mucedo]